MFRSFTPWTSAAANHRFFSEMSTPDIEVDVVDDAEEELIRWDPEAKNPLHLQVTFEDVSRAVYKIRSGKTSFLS